jgi:hypothetical protein
MKKYLFVLVAAAMFVADQVNTYAQTVSTQGKRPHLTEQQIIDRRTDQMVKVLMLDDATTTKFIPVYSQYLKDKMACSKMMRGEKQNHKAQEIMTDAQLDEMMKARFAQSSKMLSIREDYYARFRRFLSPRQIMKIFETEKSNEKKMKREMEKRRQMKGARQRGPQHQQQQSQSQQ